MTRFAARCPNCSAPVEFLWSGSVQAVCRHCRSIVVRHDVNVEAIGRIADLPSYASLIQLGTEGRADERPFTVIGRIAYEYEAGGWNEWHVLFDDDSNGWLAEAQGEYAVSRQVVPPAPLPAAGAVALGQRFGWFGHEYIVTTITEARYAGVQGELPFETWNRDVARFADLRSPDDRFATMDYTEEPPLLFLGRVVAFDALGLRNLRTPVAPQAEVRGLNCASCGAPVELRAGAQTLTAVCGHCLAVVDPLDPSVAIVQEAARRERHAPKIPLGTRGRVRGEEYEVIGFQYRTITVDDEEYGWDEYVLFNPQHGFRYLSEYAGHWNDIKVVSSLPELASRGGRSAARFLGERFRHFQHAVATTRFVLGEFPWRVRVGDEAVVDDYVSPPRMLSAERTGDEVTWSLGEYTPGARVWEMFGLRDRPPRAVGVFANQPSPHTGRPGRYWRLFLAMAAALALVALIRFATAARQEVFAGDYAYASAQAGESAFVTPVFDVPGHTSNLEVGIDTDLSNDWLYLSLALINADSGTAYDFGREVGYYFGRDSDGSWTEGSRRDRALLASVPPGRYYLRVEPEGATAGRPVRYRLRLRRDVPSLSIFLVALLLLAVPPSLATWRAAAFETKRWAESDHG